MPVMRMIYVNSSNNVSTSHQQHVYLRTSINGNKVCIKLNDVHNITPLSTCLYCPNDGDNPSSVAK